MRNYMAHLVAGDFPMDMQKLDVSVLETEGIYCVVRGILLMLAEENQQLEKRITIAEMEIERTHRQIIRLTMNGEF